MFSSTEYQYIKDLTINYFNNGYSYYSCITNNPIGLNNTNNVIDISCYYSKSKKLSSGIRCDFDSNNYSTNNTIDKLTCNNYNSLPNFSKKEYVYSNVSLNSADIIAEFNELHYCNLFLVSIIFLLSCFFIKKFLDILWR